MNALVLRAPEKLAKLEKLKKLMARAWVDADVMKLLVTKLVEIGVLEGEARGETRAELDRALLRLETEARTVIAMVITGQRVKVELLPSGMFVVWGGAIERPQTPEELIGKLGNFRVTRDVEVVRGARKPPRLLYAPQLEGGAKTGRVLPEAPLVAPVVVVTEAKSKKGKKPKKLKKAAP